MSVHAASLNVFTNLVPTGRGLSFAGVTTAVPFGDGVCTVLRPMLCLGARQPPPRTHSMLTSYSPRAQPRLVSQATR